MTRVEQLSENVTLYLGDCRDVLPTLSGIDAVVTDPPYGLSFMGKKWDYDVPSVEVWRLVLEAIKPGAHLLSFAGTRTQHRMAVNIEDAGFDIRDLIAWVYGSGFPKSHNLNGQWEGWGTAFKPALEPVTVARKPLVGTVAENVMQYGTGAINIDGCRVGTESTIRNNNVSLGSSGNGIYGKAGACIAGSHSGRFPANLIHDGSDEVVGLFPYTTSGKPGVMRACVNRSAAYGAESRQPGTPMTGFGDSGSAARFFYCAKASKADRDEGCEGLSKRMSASAVARVSQLQGEEATCISNTKHPRHNHHPTVKPTALMRYLCRLITPPGGVVFDPFMGSGSTGKAAILEGFGFIGIERDPEYFEIACRRIAAALKNTAPLPGVESPQLAMAI